MRAVTYALLCLLPGVRAFAPPPARAARGLVAVRAEPAETVAAPAETVAAPAETAAAPAAAAAPDDAPPAAAAPAVPAPVLAKNQPTWDVQQHLYGADGGAALPLPPTYITCGQCKALFAISEADLGDKGKGCRVKCTVCNNSWFQSRERLFPIPQESHDMLPARQSDIERIAGNLARDLPPGYQGVGKLYVGNLDWRTTSEDLREFFVKHAQRDEGAAGEDGEEGEKEAGKVGVCDASVVMGPDGRSRGFAFVSFYSEADGQAGLACHGRELGGREVAVREPNN